MPGTSPARRDAWNDFDDSEFDYQIVYPGPNGFIPTIESESMRESWTQYDPELAEREYLPKEKRKELRSVKVDD